MMTEDRLCKKHGLTSYALESSGYYRCRKCRSDNVVNKRRALKLQAIEYMGGSCSDCGYNKCVAAMEFHHIDGSKEFAISQNGKPTSWDKIKIELEKCVLLCANCHRERHFSQ